MPRMRAITALVGLAFVASSCHAGKTAGPGHSTRGLQQAAPAASNPWNLHWNLHCRRSSAEVRVPRPARPQARRFFPWAGRGGEIALGSGPVYALIGSTHGAISRDGDGTDGRGFFVHRALLAIAGSYRGPVRIRGARLGVPARGRALLWFTTTGAAHCTVHRAAVSCASEVRPEARELRVSASPRRRGWRFRATELRLGRTGCFRVRVTGPGLAEQIYFSVPGPDYGAAGW
jgi:hypothetical protein